MEVRLTGKSGKIYGCNFTWTAGYTPSSVAHGCHATGVSGLVVGVPAACAHGDIAWVAGDDIRANEANWEVLYNALRTDRKGYSHVFISTNATNHLARHLSRKGGVTYSMIIYNTWDIMNIIKLLAEKNGDWAVISPYSSNPSHAPMSDGAGMSCCASMIWIINGCGHAVMDADFDKYWEKAAKFKCKPRVYPDFRQLSTEAIPEPPVVVPKVAMPAVNIWGN